MLTSAARVRQATSIDVESWRSDPPRAPGRAAANARPQPISLGRREHPARQKAMEPDRERRLTNATSPGGKIFFFSIDPVPTCSRPNRPIEAPGGAGDSCLLGLRVRKRQSPESAPLCSRVARPSGLNRALFYGPQQFGSVGGKDRRTVRRRGNWCSGYGRKTCGGVWEKNTLKMWVVGLRSSVPPARRSVTDIAHPDARVGAAPGGAREGRRRVHSVGWARFWRQKAKKS